MESVAEQLTTTLRTHLRPPPVWSWGEARSWRLDFSRPLIMGIVNVTPDSFSGDGLAAHRERAIAQGVAMVAAGADLLDVGGESTRPGARAVAVEEECQRVLPVIRELARQVSVPVSVDTSKPAVMVAALEAGAALVNDVTALSGPEGGQTARMLAARKIPLALMHMQNTPATMQQAPAYENVVSDVYGFLAERLAFCVTRGMDANRLLVDPGIGFGKTTAHNLSLLQRGRVFRGLGAPLLMGLSRKRVVGVLTGAGEPRQRDVGSHLLGALASADILRVHDVAGAKQTMAALRGLTHPPLEAAA
ncbi:MAG: dihydropteroate synthase [Magnetococcales bacterium]|nr:dihydropteroate synthase [Magnetococcales bacterium]